MTPARDPYTIALAAGGTGGHLFPAEALARELIGRGVAVTLMTDSRGAKLRESVSGLDAEIVAAGTIGAGLKGKIKGLAALTRGYFQARRLLKKMKPAAIVGFGGYPSVPSVLAARHLGIAVILHEQNALLGRANRLLAAPGVRIATSFPEVSRLPAAVGTLETGNPVRPAFSALRETSVAAPVPINGHGRFHILVTGGSQGASIFSNVVPRALAQLTGPTRARISVSQQCRPEDIERVRALYEAAGIDAELATFFSDVPERLARAALVICRSGASTIAELTVVGRPAIFVPYPHAMDDHQTANAKAVVSAGAGWLMPNDAFTPASLAARIEMLLALPQNLGDAAAKARALGRPDAAAALADMVLGSSSPAQATRPEETPASLKTLRTADSAL